MLGTASSQIKMQARLVPTVIRYDEKVYKMETVKVIHIPSMHLIAVINKQEGFVYDHTH